MTDYTPIIGPVDGEKRRKRIEALADHDRKLRNETLEEAAQVAQGAVPYGMPEERIGAFTAAAAIRAMSETIKPVAGGEGR